MKYRGASQLMLGGMAMVLLTAPGCSGMKWFQSGSDEATNSGSTLSASGGASGGYGSGGVGRDDSIPHWAGSTTHQRRRAASCAAFPLL